MKNHDRSLLLRTSLSASALLATTTLSSPSWAHETYQLRSIGHDQATGIDEDGRVAASDGGGSPQALRVDGSIDAWSQPMSYAYDTGSDGMVVGLTNTSWQDAFLYDTTGFHTLVDARLVAVSENGYAVGTQASQAAPGNDVAIEWDGIGAPTVLTVPGWDQAEALDISPDGDYVVGLAQDSSYSYGTGVIWDRQAGTAHVLPNWVAQPGGGFFSAMWVQARAVNDDGDVVGTIGRVAGKPVIWHRTGSSWTAQELGPALPGTSTCVPNAINADGIVVGDCDLFTEAFIWHPGDTTLTSLLDEVDPASAIGWALAVAYDINDQGQIVGTGFAPSGGIEGFVLQPGSACLRPCTFSDGTTLEIPIGQCDDLGGSHSPFVTMCAQPTAPGPALPSFP